MRRIVVVALALVALAPATASAGGWATVGLSTTPDGLPAGTPWVVDIEVLQHGLTPLDGVQPAVVVTSPNGVAKPPVPAVATGRPGVYRARVTFPAAGEWTYAVEDGFGRTHHFPAVEIGSGDRAAAAASERRAGAPAAPVAPRSDGGISAIDVVIAVLAGVAAAGGVELLRRREWRRARAAAPSGG